jgi:hypothetical protein
MDASELYGGAFLSAELLKKDNLFGNFYTIASWEIREFPDRKDRNKKVQKIVLDFKEIKHELPLNATNANVLIKDFGAETDGWIGNKISFKIIPWPTGAGVGIKSKEELQAEGSGAAHETETTSPPKVNVTDEQALTWIEELKKEMTEKAPGAEQSDENIVAYAQLNKAALELADEDITRIKVQIVQKGRQSKLKE